MNKKPQKELRELTVEECEKVSGGKYYNHPRKEHWHRKRQWGQCVIIC